MASSLVQKFNIGNAGVGAILAEGPSLFLALYGIELNAIEEWNSPGEKIRSYIGHTSITHCLLKNKGYLWSGSEDATIRVWDTQIGVCLKIFKTDSYVYCLCKWRGNIISGGENPFLREWDTNLKASPKESLRFKWKVEDLLELDILSVTNQKRQRQKKWRTKALVVCGEWLCSAGTHIILWKEDYTPLVVIRTPNLVCSVAIVGECIFSGGYNGTIHKWNLNGECVDIFTHHSKKVGCLIVDDGQLYSGSEDGTIMKCSLKGAVLQKFEGHNGNVCAIAMWRGGNKEALFSGGEDDNVIQWKLLPMWNPYAHKEFCKEIRCGIKTMMLLAFKHHFPSLALPMAVLQIIFQLYAS